MKCQTYAPITADMRFHSLHKEFIVVWTQNPNSMIFWRCELKIPALGSHPTILTRFSINFIRSIAPLPEKLEVVDSVLQSQRVLLKGRAGPYAFKVRYMCELLLYSDWVNKCHVCSCENVLYYISTYLCISSIIV